MGIVKACCFILNQHYGQKLEVNPKAKALVFDLDGTLADTMPVHYWAYKNILVKYGIDLTNKNYTIYNILGAKISSGVVSNANNSININDFANGTYLLRLNNESAFKFVKE